jgi:CBS domain-containing protein
MRIDLDQRSCGIVLASSFAQVRWRVPEVHAIDVMTPSIVTAGPDTPITDLIRLMLSNAVNAIPIVDRDALVGIVSEGDLIRRAELGTERAPSYWRVLIRSTARLAADYVHTHGRTAKEVMTSPVITVADTASLGEIAELLEKNRIGRVPVLRGGKLMGVVSRADLLRALAARIARPLAVDDDRIRDALIDELRAHPWGGSFSDGTVMVEDGVVHLWGTVGTDVERQARIAAAESTEGVRRVEDHMAISVAPDLLDRPNWPSAGRP